MLMGPYLVVDSAPMSHCSKGPALDVFYYNMRTTWIRKQMPVSHLSCTGCENDTLKVILDGIDVMQGQSSHLTPFHVSIYFETHT